MDELKEKIARAIAYKKYSTPYDELMHYVRSQFEGQAQAALTAIEQAGYVLTRKQQVEGATHGCEPMAPAAAAALYGRWPSRAECNARPPYAALSDSATSFDPERQFEKDREEELK